jgi:hypothetical protein
MKNSKSLLIIIIGLSGFLLVALIVIAYLVTTSSQFNANNQNKSYAKNVCWNFVNNLEGTYYWANGCKGNPDAEVCTQALVSLSAEEKQQYLNWLVSDQSLPSACILTSEPEPMPTILPTELPTETQEASAVVACENVYTNEKFNVEYKSVLPGSIFNKDGSETKMGDLCEVATLSNGLAQLRISQPIEAVGDAFVAEQIVNYKHLTDYKMNINPNPTNGDRFLVSFQFAYDKVTSDTVSYSSMMLDNYCNNVYSDASPVKYTYCGSNIIGVAPNLAVRITCKAMSGSVDDAVRNSCDNLVKSLEITKQ